MIELNLLEKKEPMRLPVVLGVDLNQINLVMIFIAILVWYIPQAFVDSYFERRNEDFQNETKMYEEKIAKLKTEIGKNTQIKEMLKAYQEQVEKLKARSSQVDEILKIRTNPKKILEKLARSVPEDLWFDSIRINNKDEIFINGGAYTSRSLGEFISLINESPYFAGSISPIKQENKQENLDGSMTSYEVFELKGNIKSFDMRVK